MILSEFVDGTQNSTGYYWSKIIAGLAGQLDEVLVVCPSDSYRRLTRPPPNVTYLPFAARAFSKNRLASRTLGQVFHAMQFCRVLIAKLRAGDIVFSGTNPALSILVVAALKKFVDFKWILLVHDVFPENLHAAKLIGGKNPLYLVLKWIFGHAYSSADTMIAIGRDMREVLIDKSPGKSRIVCIPNWVDLADTAPLDRGWVQRLTQKDWKDKTVFQFFGNFGRVQGLRNLLDALRLVSSKKAAFVFIGSGASQDLISRFMLENPDLNVACLPPLPFSENNYGLAACDVAVVSLARGMKGLAVPSKAYFSLAADRPILVIADLGSELQKLLTEETAIGWYCESGHPSKLAKVIDAICDMNRDYMRGKPRSVVAKRFNYESAMVSYMECVNELRTREN
jgi:glycosyltransferase involved in cell wall biosynthesis